MDISSSLKRNRLTYWKMVREGVAMQSIRYPNLQVEQTNDDDVEDDIIGCYKYASSSDDEPDIIEPEPVTLIGLRNV